MSSRTNLPIAKTYHVDALGAKNRRVELPLFSLHLRFRSIANISAWKGCDSCIFAIQLSRPRLLASSFGLILKARDWLQDYERAPLPSPGESAQIWYPGSSMSRFR
jgi:hypothetical protein